MKEKFRIYDELIEIMRGFFLRPALWAHSPEAFNDDNRECWTSSCFINMKGIKKLSKETNE